MSFETKVTEAQEHQRDSSPERQMLFKMLEAYWGKGDGNTPPAFIAEAAQMCGFPL